MLSFLLTGFKLPERKGPENFNYKTINLFKNNFAHGLITAFLGDPSMRSTIKQASYYLTKKEVFKGKYLVGNYYDEDKEFILFCLLDYQQVELVFGDQKRVYHRLFLKKGEEVEAPISIGHIPKGAHDFVLVLLDISKKGEKIIAINNAQTHRANIFSGSESFPKNEYVAFSPKSNNTKFDIFKLEPQNKKEHSWKKINLNINNSNEKKIDVLTLLFDNFIQINGCKSFFKLDQYQEIQIPYDLKKNPELMFCLKINNPYAILEPEPSVLSDIDTTIEISNSLIPDNPF